MKIEFNKRYTSIAIYTFFVVALSIMFYGVVTNAGYFITKVSVFLDILTPFTIGLAIAFILNPVLKCTEHQILPIIFKDRLSRKTTRSLGIAITYLFALIMISVFLLIVIPEVIISISRLVPQITNFINNINNMDSLNTAGVITAELMAWLPENLQADIRGLFASLTEEVIYFISNTLRGLLPMLVNMTTTFFSGIVSVFVAIVVSIYMLADKERFFAQMKKIIAAITPIRSNKVIMEIAHESGSIFSGFVIGKMIDSIIIGIICYVVLALSGTPNAILVSLIVGVTNVIPYFGPFIGAIPSFFIILIGSPPQALWFLIFILILQQFDGNILGPKILGDSTGLSAFWVVFAVIVFAGLLGFVGMFIGVPVFAVIYTITRRIINLLLRKKDLSEKTSDYASEYNQIL